MANRKCPGATPLDASRHAVSSEKLVALSQSYTQLHGTAGIIGIYWQIGL